MYHSIQLIDSPIYEINTGDTIKRKRSVQIWKAVFENELVYCVFCPETEHAELIDYNENIIQDVIRFANKKERYLVIDKSHGREYARYDNINRGRSISLREYVFAKYNSISDLNLIRDHMHILLIDKSLREFNVLDIRSNNLYNATGLNNDGIEIITRDRYPEEKYIYIEKDGFFAIQDYSSGLDELMRFRKYSRIVATGKYGRLSCILHYKKNGFITTKLSRTVLLYNMFYLRYKTLKGFVRSYPLINDRFGDEYECGHINAVAWNNCENNIMRMSQEANYQMKDYIQDFVGLYNAFPIVYRKDGLEIILVELVINKRPTFWTCDSPETYLDFQRVLLGRGITESTQLTVNGSEMNTPQQERKRIPKSKEPLTAEMVKTEFWKWCDKRDNLIRLYETCPGAFTSWYPCEKGEGNFAPIVANLRTLANLDTSQAIMIVSKLNAEGLN